MVTTVLCAWTVLQPQRSQAAADKAVELANKGDMRGALREADRARHIDPYSPDPLFARATVLSESGRLVAAYRVLEQAAAEHPATPRRGCACRSSSWTTSAWPGARWRPPRPRRRIDPASSRVRTVFTRAQGALTREQKQVAAAEQVLQAQIQRQQAERP